MLEREIYFRSLTMRFAFFLYTLIYQKTIKQETENSNSYCIIIY